MPIYEYVCQSCQHRFEIKQSMSDPPVTSCMQCGRAVTKVISAPAIMFKGTGWYVTDYSDKLKPGADSKTEEKDTSTQKKDGDSSSVTPTPASTAAPASPSSSTGSANTPAAAATGASTTAAPAAPATSPTK